MNGVSVEKMEEKSSPFLTCLADCVEKKTNLVLAVGWLRRICSYRVSTDIVINPTLPVQYSITRSTLLLVWPLASYGKAVIQPIRRLLNCWVGRPK